MGNRHLVPGIFFDRDGVLVQDVYYDEWKEWEAPLYPEDVVLLPTAIEALKNVVAEKIPLFLVSNQGGYAKGKTALENLFEVHKKFEEILKQEHIRFTDVYYSYSHPEGTIAGFSGVSLERKPGWYFLQLAAAKYGINLSTSWMIGDRYTDIMCGSNAGTKTALVKNPHSKQQQNLKEAQATIEVNTVLEAVNHILKNIQK